MGSVDSKSSGRVIWITGLSGAGKTTLALKITSKLRASGRAVVFLDGDEMREALQDMRAASSGYCRKDRVAIAMAYSRLCRLLSEQGFIVVISTISLFQEVHNWNRDNLADYFEVYLKVPLSELKKRDTKGIYQGFEKGLVTNVAGLDIKIDEPETPDLIFEYQANLSPDEMANLLEKKLQ